MKYFKAVILLMLVSLFTTFNVAGQGILLMENQPAFYGASFLK